jgi:hypothetical protein
VTGKEWAYLIEAAARACGGIYLQRAKKKPAGGPAGCVDLV